MNWQRLRLLKDAMRSLFDIQLQAVIIRNMYGPHGIQQEGRLFEIGEEASVESGEHRQGKIGKNQSWKYAFDCQNCGKRSAGRSDKANRFCRNECQQEYQVNRWFACSCCLARIGLGQNTAAKILGIVTKTAVGRGWKSKGIVPEKPKSGSMVTEWRLILTVKRKEIEAIENEPQRFYDEAAMEDIRSHRRFPDWSQVWGNKLAMDEYNSPENIYERCCMRSIRAHGFRSVYPDWSQVWVCVNVSWLFAVGFPGKLNAFPVFAGAVHNRFPKAFGQIGLGEVGDQDRRLHRGVAGVDNVG